MRSLEETGTSDSVAEALFERLKEVPIIDPHTHLVGGRLGARGLHDLLLYHMAVSDLYAAGCPTGSRLTQYPGWPSAAEAETRIRQAIPHLSRVFNTSTSWGLRLILRDLYGWDRPITEGNWRTLDGLVRERADAREWHRDVVARAGIRRFGTEIARREAGQDDDLLEYALEWAFFTRCQWGEFDTALYELERCWGRKPECPTLIGSGARPSTERQIRSLEDVHAAVDHYVENIPVDEIVSTATHISTDIDYRVVTPDEMAAALRRRSTAGPEERDIYASYINEVFLTKLEERNCGIVFQFSLGAEPLPHETASRISQKTIAQVGEIISRHPRVRMQCFLSSAHANQSLCTLCRELPNFSLAGYWWHNFFPSIIRRVMEERLDMLPLNKQVGFFSDAYCVEWAYAKATMVRRLLAEVLAQKVQLGQYTQSEAVEIAQAILFDSPRELLGIEPRQP